MQLQSILSTPGAATDGRGWIVLGAVFRERSAYLHFLHQTKGDPPVGWQKKFITGIQMQLENVLTGDKNNLLLILGKNLFDPLLGWDVVKRDKIPERPGPPNYNAVDHFLSKATLFCNEQEKIRKRKRLENVEPSRVELEDISEACDRLWDLDTDLRLKPGKDYTINLQRTTGGRRDAAPDELFSYINDDKLNNTPVFAKFIPLLDNYEFEVGKAENHDNAIERREVSDFLDACLDTACIRYTYKWLIMNKRFNGNYKIAFKRKLKELWFDGYSRASRNRRETDSSAFEHVFVGEHKRDRDTGKISVIGMHNWLAFLTFERQGTWNYYGFKKPKGRRGRSGKDFENEQVMTLVFEWEGQVKPVSTTFFGTSPSFEIALYTLAFMCDGGQEKIVPCKMGPYRLGIQVYTYRGAKIGSCHPADAPANFDEAAAFIQSRVRGRQERQRFQNKRGGGGSSSSRR
jgi:poly(U)-specific endoribonuclease